MLLLGCATVGVWGCGAVGPWDCGAAGLWGPGTLGVWECGSVGVWECGSVGVWEYESVGVWECGSVGVWECGSVGVWEEEEEEEGLPRSHGRWALASSPWGPAQTSQGSPPSYLRKSKTDLAAHLRTLFLAGRSGLSVGERQRYGPICLQVPITNRLKVLDPPKSASQNCPAREGVGLPGASSPTCNVARQGARSGPTTRYAGTARAREFEDVITYGDKATGRADPVPPARP